MAVRNVRWVGTATEHDDAMKGFLGGVLGLRTNVEGPTSTEFITADGDEGQVMGPGDP